MKLSRLLCGMSYELLQGDVNMDICGLADNSKKCKNGYAFFAIVGNSDDGTKYISEAISNGAKCIIFQEEIENIELKDGVGYVKVQNIRKAMSLISQNFYIMDGYKFKLIGITGTNGKTTTSFMIGETLINCGYNVCVVGTSGIFINGKQLRGEALTTPDPIDLFSLFAFCNSVYIDYVIMEVSAHALILEKVYGLTFDYGIFTNLTEDHLDFFGDMENYGNAKLKLFNTSICKKAIINIDDEYGKTIALLRGNSEISFYGKASCDYKITPKSYNSFKLKYNNKNYKIILSMPGEYNYYNATASIAVLLQEEVKIDVIKKSLKNLSKIDGRFNHFKTKQHGKVILDFAHTPDGLSKLLTNVRTNLCRGGRIISVFGCGGNRDRNKRPIMGRISGKLADYTIISIDNPRCEDAFKVMSDIEVGVKEVTDNYDIVMPRVKAIERAISMSSPEDVVVISGKGTEPYYEVNGSKMFYREDIVIECIINKLEG